MRGRTHEEYVNELKEKGIVNIIPLEEYNGAGVPILHKCLVHNLDWKARPYSILHGQQCPKCGGEKSNVNRRRTTEQYKRELEDKGIEVKPLEEYKNAKTPILHLCLKHNIEWKTIPDRVLKGNGCPMCAKEKYYATCAKTTEQYIDELHTKNIDVEPLEEYKGARVPILHRCLKHSVEWLTPPDSVLSGRGCKICGSEKRAQNHAWDTERYIKELKFKGMEVKPLEEYAGYNTPILHKCLIHGTEWMTKPSSVLQGHSCHLCRKEKLQALKFKSNEQYIEDLKNISPFIVPLEEYKGVYEPTLHLCTKHNFQWMAIPHNLLNGCGCPMCHESRGEIRIAQWLNSKGIPYKCQTSFDDCRDKKPLPFDFYIPDMNAIIEYDGVQHYKPVPQFGGEEGFEYCKKHDAMKTEYCLNNNIRLLRIPYYKNVEKELDSFIYNK